MLLDILFPKHCLGCHTYGTYLCTNCATKMTRHTQICVVCRSYSPFGQTHPFCKKHTPLDGIIIATEYRSLIKSALHAIKYKLTYDILNELAERTLLSEKIKTCLQDQQITICTEIPMHHSKENQRGFNQARLLCQWIQKKYQIQHKTLLTKTRQTIPQMRLHRADRLFNLKDAFQIIPNQNITGQNILLCDDVTTTATTLEEAAKILKQNKAHKVYGLVIASSG